MEPQTKVQLIARYCDTHPETKQQVRPWKLMVGRWNFPFGARPGRPGREHGAWVWGPLRGLVVGMGKCFEGKRVVGTRKKKNRIEVIIHEHVFKNCFVGWMVVFKTFLKIYPHHFYSGFVFGCPEITTRSPRLGDLQLRMDANDGKLKSLSEAELWDWWRIEVWCGFLKCFVNRIQIQFK